MTPPTPSPNLSGHVHRLIIENKTKKRHNLVCWHQKNYPYHTEFVSWRVDHFSFFFYFPITRGGVSALLEFSNFFFFFETFPYITFFASKQFLKKNNTCLYKYIFTMMIIWAQTTKLMTEKVVLCCTLCIWYMVKANYD